MTEIRTKDKLFLAVVIPVALLAAYWYGWRASAGRQLAELESRQAQLVTAEDFPMEKRRADRELAEANAELDAEKREGERPREPRQAPIVADAGTSEAERERQILQVFRDAGLTVVGSETPKGDSAAHASKTGELLKATGVRPKPIHHSYTIDGRYPDVVKALKSLAEKKMAAIPDSLQMRATGRNRWTLEVWL